MSDESLSDPTKMTEEELYRLNIFHEVDDSFCEAQLHSLYGKVNEDQDREIIAVVTGHTVLDVGAGYGLLSRRLKERGLNTIAIEPNAQTRVIAKKWNGVDELPYGIYETPFEDNFFDTVILRECVEHLDFQKALHEIRRICNGRVLIFQTNLNPLIDLARKRIGHEEFNPQKRSYYQKNLETFGFKNQIVTFRDPVAFPLSGGYHAKQLLPKNERIELSVLGIDKAITKIMKITHLGSTFCWRYLLIADK